MTVPGGTTEQRLATAVSSRRRAAYWSDKAVFAHAGPMELASVSYEVDADFSKPLRQAWSLTITLRALGAYLGSTTVTPIRNGVVSMRLIEPIGGSVNGRIDDFSARDADGKLLADTDAAWSHATIVTFLVTANSSLDLPVASLASLVPGLGWAIHAALALTGPTVRVNVGHKAVALPIHRDGAGHPLYPK